MNLFEYILDLVLPSSKFLREIEKMSARSLRQKIPRAQENLPPDTFALFDYKNPLIRQAIWALKYRGNKKIAALLADCLHEELVEEIAERNLFENFTQPLLIPIPLSKKRERERGFNQCFLLSAALGERGGVNFFTVKRNVLFKIKDTE